MNGRAAGPRYVRQTSSVESFEYSDTARTERSGYTSQYWAIIESSHLLTPHALSRSRRLRKCRMSAAISGSIPDAEQHCRPVSRLVFCPGPVPRRKQVRELIVELWSATKNMTLCGIQMKFKRSDDKTRKML